VGVAGPQDFAGTVGGGAQIQILNVSDTLAEQILWTHRF
jgi:hypothetical protein